MYKMHIVYDDLIATLNAYHKVVNKAAIRKAYTYANAKHEGQKRKTGEAYIMHPLRVAKLIAEWGFDSDVVTAALLHDVAEDCNTSIDEIKTEFGSNVAEMVDSLTSVNANLAKESGMTKIEMDNMSDARLIRKVNPKALLIKTADRLDNLYTIHGVPEAKQFGKAQHTREILIPMLKLEGAYKLINELEDLCIRIEHKDRYQDIVTRYNLLRKQNAFTTKKVLEMLDDAFKNDTLLLPSELMPYRNYVADFIFTPRSTISIYRQLIREATNFDKELPYLLNKRNIALYDLTLIIKNDFAEDDSLTRPLDVFFLFYEKLLMDKGLCICDYRNTTYSDSRYLILRDQMDNYYRLFVKSEEQYLRYKLGDIIDDHTSFSFPDVVDVDPRDTYNPKIKVFKKDGSELYIDAGSTVLDFAFAIHSEIGLHFDYALVDNAQTRFPAYTRLNEGDKITIVTKEDKTATINWFKYVRTSKAVDHLVKHFG